MKSLLHFRVLVGAVAPILLFSSTAIAAPEPTGSEDAMDHLPVSGWAVPPQEYYRRLAKLSGEPAAPALPSDAQRFPTAPSLVEEILSHRPQYLAVTAEAFKIPPPPANSSLQTRAELDYLLRLQQHRTPMEMAFNLDFMNWGYIPAAQARDRDFLDLRGNFFRVGRSIGTWFTAEKLPMTADLVARTWQEARFYLWSLKNQYARVRPYQLEPKIKNLQDANWPAYPSGHATYAYMLGYLYSTINPAHRTVFMADAYTIAHSREVIGVHFPSDSEAGRILAQRFVELMLKNEKFAQELKGVEAEWENAAREYP